MAETSREGGREVSGLREALEALHRDGGYSQGYFGDGYGDHDHCCTECGTFGEYGVEWPCDTLRLLDAHPEPDAPTVGLDVETVDRKVGAILFNASNYPKGAQSALVGRDIGPLRKKVVAAVIAADPRRTVAEVKAEALREFADSTRFPSDWILFRRDDGSGVTVPDLLRETAANRARIGGQG